MLGPVVLCGPPNLKLRKPVILSFQHCASLKNGQWILSVYSCDTPSSEPPHWQVSCELMLTSARFVGSCGSLIPLPPGLVNPLASTDPLCFIVKNLVEFWSPFWCHPKMSPDAIATWLEVSSWGSLKMSSGLNNSRRSSIQNLFYFEVTIWTCLNTFFNM